MKNFPWKQLLQRHSIFSTIHDERKIDALLADGVSEERVYAKDVNIVRQGDQGNSLFVIGSGSAEALLEIGGGETISLSKMRKGDVFGEMAFFEQGSRAATVRTKEPCTVLEINGPEFQKLVDEFPDIGFRLLLLMGERLRQTNERILSLHLKTVDEKLDLFNKRLETDQRVAEAELKAAQTVFDQIKVRTDEIISSAERSRNRLTFAASVVGTFVTIIIGLLGLFGYKELSRVETYAKESQKYRDDAQKSAAAVDTIKKKAEDAAKGLVEIYRARFFDALKMPSGDGARQAYKQIKKEAGGIDDLHGLLYGMEYQVVPKAQPPPEGDSDQRRNVRDFVSLFQQAALDAATPRDKLDAHYLLLVYASLAGQSDFPEKEDEFKSVSTPGAVRAALAEYVNSAAFKEYRRSAPADETPRTAAKELADRIEREPGKRRDDLSELSRLALVSLKGD